MHRKKTGLETIKNMFRVRRLADTVFQHGRIIVEICDAKNAVSMVGDSSTLENKKHLLVSGHTQVDITR